MSASEAEGSARRGIKPIRTFAQEIEMFEVFSPKLGRKITVALKHNPDDLIPANLLSDGGLVMMPVSEDFGRLGEQ